MDNGWGQTGEVTSEGWVCAVEVKIVDRKIYVRVRPGEHPARMLDGPYDSMEEAQKAATELALSYIRDIRAAEGYPPA